MHHNKHTNNGSYHIVGILLICMDYGSYYNNRVNIIMDPVIKHMVIMDLIIKHIIRSPSWESYYDNRHNNRINSRIHIIGILVCLLSCRLQESYYGIGSYMILCIIIIIMPTMPMIIMSIVMPIAMPII